MRLLPHHSEEPGSDFWRPGLALYGYVRSLIGCRTDSRACALGSVIYALTLGLTGTAIVRDRSVGGTSVGTTALARRSIWAAISQFR
jgi:hypothetical protein